MQLIIRIWRLIRGLADSLNVGLAFVSAGSRRLAGGTLEGRPNLTPGQQELYERIRAFEFDQGGSAFPFSARLARDNGWCRAYTARVITEYRRFVFVAVTAGHPVTPSDQVDQAWHLHLLYTKSYWKRFCNETLERPLHHEPTAGGSEERDKFNLWYEKTLASYRTAFGKEPPADIWPSPRIRFGEDNHFQRFNTRHLWVIPKPWALGARS
jgi:hypothetical protein